MLGAIIWVVAVAVRPKKLQNDDDKLKWEGPKIPAKSVSWERRPIMTMTTTTTTTTIATHW